MDSGEVLLCRDDDDFQGVILEPSPQAAGKQGINCANYNTDIAGVVLRLSWNGDWFVSCEIVVENPLVNKPPKPAQEVSIPIYTTQQRERCTKPTKSQQEPKEQPRAEQLFQVCPWSPSTVSFKPVLAKQSKKTWIRFKGNDVWYYKC